MLPAAPADTTDSSSAIQRNARFRVSAFMCNKGGKILLGFFMLCHSLPGTSGPVSKFCLLRMAQLDRNVAEPDTLEKKLIDIVLVSNTNLFEGVYLKHNCRQVAPVDRILRVNIQGPLIVNYCRYKISLSVRFVSSLLFLFSLLHLLFLSTDFDFFPVEDKSTVPNFD